MQNEDKVYRNRILSNYEIAPNVFVLTFERNIEFTPGQVIYLQLDRKSPSRMYSIASGKDEDQVRLLYDIKYEGYLTPLLAKLKEGDKIFVSEPFGTFLNEVQPEDWFISSGTGIAPFNSYIQSYHPTHIKVIHGSRTLAQFYFKEELEYLNQNYIRCCSRETDLSVYPGRLTKYVKEIKHFDKNINYYLCGSAEMVNEVREILILKGIPFDKIQSEIYF